MIPIYYIHVHISIYLFIYSFCFMLLWNSVFSSFHFSRVRNLHQEVLGNKSKRKDFPKRVKRFQSPVPFIMWLTSITVHGRICLCPILLLLDLNLSIFSPYRQLLYLFTSLINMFKMLPTPSSAKKKPPHLIPQLLHPSPDPYSTKLIEEIGYICLHLLTSHLLCNSKQLEQERSPEIILTDECSPNKKIKM